MTASEIRQKVEAARKAVPLSVLKQKCRELQDRSVPSEGQGACGEPVIDEYMIYAARAAGEKAVVLDPAYACRADIVFFMKIASFVGIGCVFRARTFGDVSEAVSLGAKAVQIAQDDRRAARILARLVPSDVRIVSLEKAVRTPVAGVKPAAVEA